MGIRVRGLTGVRKAMTNVGKDITSAGVKALRLGAAKIEKRAKEFAPREYSSLEDSIQTKEVRLSTNSYREVIFVDKGHPAPERGSGKTVGDYADIVDQGGRGGIGLGPESIAKASSLGLQPGVQVGPKFIERAFMELVDVVRKDVAAATAAAILGKALAQAEKAAAKGSQGRANASMGKSVLAASRRTKTTPVKKPKAVKKARGIKK